VELLQEVLQGELPLEHLLRGSRGAFGVDRVLRLLDQGHDVAHPEDPSRHPIGMERLEILELLARPREEDRPAGH
jgi:hypothetical protein